MPTMSERPGLTRYAWLSIGAAITTMGLKASAYLLTGSVGLLSDALESGVNLIAAVIALVTLSIVARPPDEEHAYGHEKAEYFSSGAEGALILIASLGIFYQAVTRLIDPQPLRALDIGLGISMTASVINFAAARIILRAGSRERSIALEADAQHLLSDVWTSGAILLGVAVVAITGWDRLDPVVALLAAVFIASQGIRIVRRSALGLMDTALPEDQVVRVERVLESYKQRGVSYHALRTRQAGARAFVSTHILVPGEWSVQHGHDLMEELEQDIRREIPYASVFIHIEPVEDPLSWRDQRLGPLDSASSDGGK